MSEQVAPQRDEDDLAFLGRIGAGVSHEMRNVLSIIGENAGLLDDQLALAERGKPLDDERLKKISARITRQVQRGTQTMERFSRFAHAADEPTAAFDLTALLETMTALAQREVALAGGVLATALPEKAIRVRSNPFRLQRAVFSAIQLILESQEQGASVTVGLAAEGSTAAISVSGGAAAGGEVSAGISRLSAMVDELKGSVETSRKDARLTLILTIPLP
jgi:signal transduction histidine kinase